MQIWWCNFWVLSVLRRVCRFSSIWLRGHKMAEHLHNHYGRSFPGCLKALVHFLDVHQHLHLKKMKMLAYRRHGEDKNSPRTKVSNAYPDDPSTSQHVYTEDACSVVEGNINDIKKHSGKSSMKISIPKWRLREQHKKRNVSQSASRLLRTVSIHHMRSENHVTNVSSGAENSAIEQSVDRNNIYASSEQLNILTSNSDEDILEKQCDKHWSYSKSGSSSQTQFDELESHLQIKEQHFKCFSNEREGTSSAQKVTDGKELQRDIILYPSKEFLAMMKLFNGNIELIQKILEDPSFIFAHYLQGQQATNAQLTKTYSFPATGRLERKTYGLFRIKHKKFESESLVKQSGNYISDNSPSHPETTEDDTPKTETTAGDEARTPKQNVVDHIETNTRSDIIVPSSILQKMMDKPPISSRFKIIKQRIKDVIKDNKKEQHHISIDGVLDKVPYGKNVLEDMKKRKKPVHWEGFDVEKHDAEGSRHANWNECSKNIQKSMKRSQSLNDSLHKYSQVNQKDEAVDCFSSLNYQVNQKDEAEFNYVREILKRFGFSGTEFPWQSPHQPVDPLIFDVAEGFSYEIDIGEDEHVMPLEHQLLFDLVNEALVEIYLNLFGYFFPWLSSFRTHIRPVPIGDHILEEVWANINWHLKGQPQLEIALDNIVARDFTKNDGWMNLQYDIEDAELEVEDLIMDDLLDDVVLQLFGLPGSSPIPCWSAPMSCMMQ